MSLEASQQASDLKSAKKCVAQVNELVFQELSKAISERLISSVNYLRESVVGTLQRCLSRLEESVHGKSERNFSIQFIVIVSITLSFFAKSAL